MALAVPKLDDRQFQDIVDELKKRIPHYCREWTDHNVSDPGVTLIELFAWMTDVMLYRLNQVPDLHYVRFLELLGITLREPEPARAPVTFWLSAPQPTPVVIPAGTEVASTQTETEASIVFTTGADLRIMPTALAAVVSRVTDSDGRKVFREHNVRRLDAGFEGLEMFTSTPQVDDALYLGFETDLSGHVLGVDLDCDPAGGAGVDPTLPPYVWEASTGSEAARWAPCEVEMDTTRALNRAGRIRMHVPPMGRLRVSGSELFWVRVRNREIPDAERRRGMTRYDLSPRLRRASAATWGGTVPATHAQRVSNELLGRSDGSPGQRFTVQHTPLLRRGPDERLVVQVDGEGEQVWREVPDLADSGAGDRHYTLDSASGEVRLGPALRQPDGTIKLYGAIPPRGANVVFRRYRYGGGQAGNVDAGVLNTLKTAIPYVAKVANRAAATGGLDAETLDAAKVRAPTMLRTRDRAVTEEDFEFLARQALPSAIGRVRCLQPRPADAGRVVPGQVFVLVIPRVREPAGYLDPAQLALRDDDVALLTEYLDERRLLTTRLEIRPPAYQWVAVVARLRPSPGADRSAVEAEVLRRLYRTLNPLAGGPDGRGWPFGRDLFVSDVYQCLQGLPDVQFVRGVEMYAADPGGNRRGEPVEEIDVLAHGVVASGLHTVEFV